MLRNLMATALLLSAFSLPVYAAGGGGGVEKPQCPAGKVYDQKSKKCVDAQRGAVDDDSLYAYGRALAHDGQYAEAIKVLSLATDKTDPRILNYLGYSHRKAGRVTVGLGYYQEALLNNPDYTLVREYMGEAYLQIGDVASARDQLTEIEKRCGKGCDEYALLAKQIEDYLKI